VTSHPYAYATPYGTERPKPTCHPSKVIAGGCYSNPAWCVQPGIYLLSLQPALITTQVLLFLSVLACHSLDRTQADPLYLPEKLIS